MRQKQNFNRYSILTQNFNQKIHKMTHVTERTKKRFKILSLFAMQLGIWADKMKELADAIDEGHPQALVALNYYEDALIAVMEAEKPKDVIMPKRP